MSATMLLTGCGASEEAGTSNGNTTLSVAAGTTAKSETTSGEKIKIEVAVGNNPGVVQIGWSFLDYFSNNFSYLAPQDAIDKYDPENSTFLTDNFLPNILDLAVDSEGTQAGIPYSVSNPVMYYNVDLFREAGLPEEGPETWEQVIEYSKIINEKTGKYGLYIEADIEELLSIGV